MHKGIWQYKTKRQFCRYEPLLHLTIEILYKKDKEDTLYAISHAFLCLSSAGLSSL